MKLNVPVKESFFVPGQLLAQGVINLVPIAKKFFSFCSNSFTVPKPNGKVRPILDLKSLISKGLVISHGVMQSIVASLQQGDSLVDRHQGCISQCVNFSCASKILLSWPQLLPIYRIPSSEHVKDSRSVHLGIL